MLQSLHTLWKDDAGSLLLNDWAFLTTILVIGALPGAIAYRHRAEWIEPRTAEIERVAITPHATGEIEQP
jgi:hypothetical protein